MFRDVCIRIGKIMQYRAIAIVSYNLSTGDIVHGRMEEDHKAYRIQCYHVVNCGGIGMMDDGISIGIN